MQNNNWGRVVEIVLDWPQLENNNTAHGATLASDPHAATEADTQSTRQGDSTIPTEAAQLPSRIIDLLLEFGRKHRELIDGEEGSDG